MIKNKKKRMSTGCVFFFTFLLCASLLSSTRSSLAGDFRDIPAQYGSFRLYYFQSVLILRGLSFTQGVLSQIWNQVFGQELPFPQNASWGEVRSEVEGEQELSVEEIAENLNRDFSSVREEDQSTLMDELTIQLEGQEAFIENLQMDQIPSFQEEESTLTDDLIIQPGEGEDFSESLRMDQIYVLRSSMNRRGVEFQITGQELQSLGERFGFLRGLNIRSQIIEVPHPNSMIYLLLQLIRGKSVIGFLEEMYKNHRKEFCSLRKIANLVGYNLDDFFGEAKASYDRKKQNKAELHHTKILNYAKFRKHLLSPEFRQDILLLHTFLIDDDTFFDILLSMLHSGDSRQVKAVADIVNQFNQYSTGDYPLGPLTERNQVILEERRLGVGFASKKSSIRLKSHNSRLRIHLSPSSMAKVKISQQELGKEDSDEEIATAITSWQSTAFRKIRLAELRHFPKYLERASSFDDIERGSEALTEWLRTYIKRAKNDDQKIYRIKRLLRITRFLIEKNNYHGAFIFNENEKFIRSHVQAPRRNSQVEISVSMSSVSTIAPIPLEENQKKPFTPPSKGSVRKRSESHKGKKSPRTLASFSIKSKTPRESEKNEMKKEKDKTVEALVSPRSRGSRLSFLSREESIKFPFLGKRRSKPESQILTSFFSAEDLSDLEHVFFIFNMSENFKNLRLIMSSSFDKGNPVIPILYLLKKEMIHLIESGGNFYDKDKLDVIKKVIKTGDQYKRNMKFPFAEHHLLRFFENLPAESESHFLEVEWDPLRSLQEIEEEREIEFEKKFLLSQE